MLSVPMLIEQDYLFLFQQVCDMQLTIFHGSEKIVEHPVFGDGKKNNDFGIGFYCTASKDLAKEWAVSSLRDGFANRYTLDTEYLHILNLNSPDYTILNWIAVLVEHRLFALKTPVARRAKRYLIDHFSINVNAFDLITGYHADDSYFDYAESFLNNAISFEDFQKMYYTLHQADISKFADIADARVREYFSETNLKRIRMLGSCTQAELAKRSGVGLRSIQMYEQRNKNINKASAETLYRLSKVLGCTMEDLIEK